MCGTCGCAGSAKTTLVNLETGSLATLAPTSIGHDAHEHVHADREGEKRLQKRVGWVQRL